MAQGLKRVIMVGAVSVVGILALMFLAGILIGYLSVRSSLDVQAAMAWVLGVFAVVLMAGSLWLGAAWMRSIDEAAQEAHKWAWYWGGSTGMAIGGALVVISMIPRDGAWTLPLPPGIEPDPAGYAAAGAGAMLLLMVIGYTVAWALWWLRRR